MFQLFGNSSSIHSGWKDGPNYRGTWDILSSCLLTLMLCVWTSVHLNLPEHGKQNAQTYRRKPLWVLMGLFMPEIVTWNAFSQFLEARRHCKQMRRLLGQPTQPSKLEVWRQKHGGIRSKIIPPEADLENNPAEENQGSRKRQNQWTPIHSHFAIMGGFALRSITASGKSIGRCGTGKVAHFKGHGIKELAARVSPHIIPDISASSIMDKSKANGLARWLLCLQALWYCVQCIGRLGRGLPISTLELNTLVHAICALLSLAFWTRKPLDVEEPIFIEDDSDIFVDHCAAVWSSQFGLGSWHATSHEGNPEPSANAEDTITINLRLEHFPGGLFNARDFENISERIDSEGCLHIISNPENDDSSLLSFSSSVPQSTGDPLLDVRGTGYVKLTANDIDYLKRVLSGRETMKLGRVFLEDKHFRYHVDRRVPDFPINRNSLDKDGETSVILAVSGFPLTTLIYGLVHVLAWDAPFASTEQSFLWRLSSVSIVSSAVIFIFLFGGLGVSTVRPHSNHGAFAQLKEIIVWGCGMFVLLYVVARVYIVVEAFIDIGYLPEAVYTTPDWTGYFPHFS